MNSILYGRFIEIQSNLRTKKLHTTNQGSNFLGGSVSDKDNVRNKCILEQKVNPSILKDDFSSRIDPSIFRSIAQCYMTSQRKPVEFFLH